MDVMLPAEIEHIINDWGAAGRYQSADEAISDAVQLMDSQKRLDAEELEWLRREIQVGVDDREAGRVRDFDLERFIAECHAEC